MRICIAGSRQLKKLELIDDWLQRNFDPVEDTLILGGAEGADKRAEEYAKRTSLSYKIYEAEWDVFGKSAVPIRNLEMVQESDKTVCFWDGKSRGTKSTIEFALRHRKHLEVIFDE